MTTAPPVMSRFIVDIASPGLIVSPPVSKVMPLPTSTTVGVPRAAFGGVVVEPDQARRRGRGLADADDAAEALVGELALVPDPDVEAVCGGQLFGLLGEPGGVLQVGRHRGQHPRAPAGAADGDRPLQARAGSPSGCSASTTRATGRSAGGSDFQWNANDPSIMPTTNGSTASGASAGIEVATRGAVGHRLGQRGARAPEVDAAGRRRRRPAARPGGRRCRPCRAAPAPRRSRPSCRWPGGPRARRADRSRWRRRDQRRRDRAPTSRRRRPVARARRRLQPRESRAAGASLSANSGGET